jgi:hypothetical protein
MASENNMKGLVILVVSSLITGAAGFSAKAIVSTGSTDDTLKQHTVQLQKLWDGQAATTAALNTLSIGQAQISGKIDTLNQKIDDDRAAHSGKH